MKIQELNVLVNRGIASTTVNGGTTLNPYSREEEQFTSGYVVGVQSLAVQDCNTLNNGRTIATLVSLLFNKISSFPGGDFGQYQYLGFWRDTETDKLHIDVVEWYPDLISAIRCAVQHGELAVFRCSDSETIRLQDITPVAPSDRTKNGKGIRTLNGVQPWSVGDIYPLIVSSRGQGSSGEWYVWSGVSGQKLKGFLFGNSLKWTADRTEDGQRKRCFDYAAGLASVLRSGKEVE